MVDEKAEGQRAQDERWRAGDERLREERTRDPFSFLTAWQRFAVRLAAACHRPPLVWIASVWNVLFVESILVPLFGRRLSISGLERLDGVSRDAPILVVANHRTWFDLFAIFYVLRRRRRKLRHPICFPVRADFFYENPLGLLVCLAFSGCTMYPPIFRKGRARAFNAHSLELLAQELRTPRRMVGFHPEGTRSKSDSPYEMLPAKRGAGELALASRPVVVPVFITGLQNSILGELRDNFRLRPTRKIELKFGSPVDLSRWPDTGAPPTNLESQACSDALMEEIARLGEEHRQQSGIARPPDR